MQQVNEILKKCSYQYINEVQQGCYKVIQNYPQLSPQILQQREGNFTRTLLELRGNVPISFNNNQYDVVTVIMFPNMYPTAPIVLKIINIDMAKLTVHQKYQKGLQPDGSVYLYLSEIQNWSFHKDPIKLMKQMQIELGQVFPFYTKRQESFQQQQPQQQQQQNFGFNQPTQFNQGFNNQQQQQFQQFQQQNNQQQQFNNNGANNQWQQQQFNNNNNNNQIPPNPLLNGNNSAQTQQQIHQKVQFEMNDIGKKVSQDIKEMKKQLDQVYELKQSLEGQEIQLQQTEIDIVQQQSEIESETKNLQSFIDKNDSNTLNSQNINDFIKEGDPLSLQIITLISDNKAMEESLELMNAAYNKGIIDLDKLLTLSKNYNEKAFENRFLLMKCIASAQ